MLTAWSGNRSFFFLASDKKRTQLPDARMKQIPSKTGREQKKMTG
jgi:hypothetical protein